MDHMISNGRRMAVTSRQRFEVFRFPVIQSTFCFSNIAIITIPAASLIAAAASEPDQQKITFLGLAITFSYQTQGIVVMRNWEI